ncbi:bifunctional (p)ppGpp synthetase/guanosine-3',5'-bis(diphosphate) 3'-pyrophosphohydrolase [bacterium]|nr:bifunctional (p)ppGpp synthetase/guanosine-3',5'-bis(diphosphate) 3'-pyrophosphohydrolase [bacterium]
MNIKDIINKIKEYNLKADINLVERAYNFAKEKHKGQKRASGSDYIEHPLNVAYCLAKMRLGCSTIAAGLLHDVVDDTDTSKEEIEKNFGKEIASLVEGVGKLGKLKYRGIQRQAENFRKLFLAMAKDIRVMIIKLCDRLHNIETLQYLPQEKQKRIARETLEIYAPVAYRLGMGKMKGQLEDLSFPYVYPKEYQQLLKRVQDKFEEREKYLKKITPVIKNSLKKEGINFIEIQSRAKHYYSLYQKLKRYNNDLDKIYDLVALRIIVKDIEDCYKTLGIIHKLYPPLPGRIKDYIARPKINGYRSLHTTVICEEGKIVEIQIRTPQMHQEAEFGIASHWYYSEQKGLKAYIKKKISKPPEKTLKWIQQLREWHELHKNLSSDRYLESLKIDFFGDRIFVLTPKGDVIDLPRGATPVDFAYVIHTDIGNRCAGARINGKISTLSTPLKDGDTVEIIVDKKKKPSRDWLSFVKTRLARTHIKKAIKKEISSDSLLQEKKIIPPPPPQISPLPKIKKPESISISLSGQTRILANLAKCCLPQPGDEIGAYITKSRGAVIHKIECENFKQLKKKWPNRIVEASWSTEKELSYKISFQITAKDRIGLFRDVSSAVSNLGINILESQAKVNSQKNTAFIKMKIQISNLKELKKLFEEIKKIKGVIEVKRE